MAVLSLIRRVGRHLGSPDSTTSGELSPPTLGLDPMVTDAMAGPGRLAGIASTRTFWPLLGVGLLGILIASMLLFWSFRYFSIQSLLAQSEAGSAVAAQATLDSLQNDIAQFLVQRATKPTAAFPDSAATTLADLARTTSVSRILIYDAAAEVVFSTRPGDIGRRETANAQLASALAGRQSSIASYRDAFSFLESRSGPGNEAIARLPLRRDRVGAVVGVFELATDLTALVAIQVRTQTLVAGGALVILLALYAAFLTGLRQIGGSLARQQDSLRESADLLPALFRRSMSAEENAEHRIALELHEQVAQTLAAVKLHVESAAAAVRRGGSDAGPLLDAVVSPLQTTIRQVREAAVALHPGSLDGHGLTATLDSLHRHASARRSDIDIGFRVELKDEDVPKPLQRVICRIVKDAVAAAVANGHLHRLRMLVGIEDDEVIFRLRDDATSANIGDPDHPYAHLREHTLLSGGRFGCRSNSWGGLVVRTTWRR